MVEQVLQDNLNASPKHLLDRLNYNYNSHLLFHWGMKNAWNIVQALHVHIKYSSLLNNKDDKCLHDIFNS